MLAPWYDAWRAAASQHLTAQAWLQGGGQETTLLSAATQLTHHGIIYIPPGYAPAPELMMDLEDMHGGSAWGAGTLAAPDGSRQPTKREIAITKKQGEYFVSKASKLAA